MLNKMNQQKAVTNTSASNKGRELFGNWELSNELGDEELQAVAGGGYGDYKVRSGDYNSRVSVIGEFNAQGPDFEGDVVH